MAEEETKAENEVATTDSESAGGPDRIKDTKVVSFHYRLCEVDSEGNRGNWLEQSFGGEPLYYLHGFHNVMVGLEKALEGKAIGDNVEITLQPQLAYGQRQENSIQRIAKKHIHLKPGQKKLLPGMVILVETNKGRRKVTVTKVGRFSIDVDVNHPFAGKILYYEIEVMSIRDASAEEITHGHVHGAGGYQH